jgi:hydrogenase maturation protein HypF
MADHFLVHNRPIHRHADDSIVRILLGREQVLRRARGYAPMPLLLRKPGPETLAVGGHLKNTVALATENRVFISQHLGNLETEESLNAFRFTLDDLERLYDAHPELIAADMHPDYASTTYGARVALSRSIPIKRIQHHWAHVLSCMADNGIDAPALGVAWDGTGYGLDGTLWGGEFLLITEGGFRRVARLRTFPLPGGDAAARKPTLAAAGLLYEIQHDKEFPKNVPGLVSQMLERQIQTPRTSSMGRLFDAVACLAGFSDDTSYEGEAAMKLEFSARPNLEECYAYLLRPGDPIVIDWEPTIRRITLDARNHVGADIIAARFHNALAEMIVEIARQVGERRVVLTGGCFQNRYLTERAVHRLTDQGFSAYWHQRVPPNDGGLALGQAIAAVQLNAREKLCVSQSQDDSLSGDNRMVC